MLRTLFVTALLLPFAFGHAAASSCPPVDAAAVTVPGVLYVTAGGSLFLETNQRAGLQSSAGSCEDDNGRPITWVADTRVL